MMEYPRELLITQLLSRPAFMPYAGFFIAVSRVVPGTGLCAGLMNGLLYLELIEEKEGTEN